MDKAMLILLNGDEKCSGEKTRNQRMEKSAIDFIFVNQRIYRNFTYMSIDEEKEIFHLSDHCFVIAKFDLQIEIQNIEKTDLYTPTTTKSVTKN